VGRILGVGALCQPLILGLAEAVRGDRN
jgi:hypothetical protein